MIEKTPYGTNGVISFNRLWHYMNKMGYNKQWLRNNGIHSNTISKLVKNQNVTCEVIANLCNLLDCQPWDIMEYTKDYSTREQTVDMYTIIDYDNIVIFCGNIRNMRASVIFGERSNMENTVSDQEIKQYLIDNYINLLRIKAAETGTNKELEAQIKVAKLKLASNSIDITEIEKVFLE